MMVSNANDPQISTAMVSPISKKVRDKKEKLGSLEPKG
jgi:hypothetical protein